MKTAYLLPVHNNPRHLKRLRKALNLKSNTFFIHGDRKSDIADFSDIKGDNIHFLSERVRVKAC